MKSIRRLFVAAISDMLFFGIAYAESALADSIARVEFDKGENGITANVRYNSNSASGKAIFAYTDKYGRLKNANVQTVSVLDGNKYTYNNTDDSALDMGEGWTDIMYQGHFYDSGTNFTGKAKSLNWYHTKYGTGVAMYVGEFNPLVFSALDFDEKYNSYKINYTVWNYKTYSPSGSGENQNRGLYYRNLSEDDVKAVSKTLNAAYRFYASRNDGKGFYHTGNLTDDELFAFYENLWCEKYLSTENFTLNETLKKYLN